MVFENLEVLHGTFGKGVVLSKNDKYMTVKFATAEKKFVYPDSFERFLTLADGTVTEEILNDIARSNRAKQQIIDMKNAENAHAMAHGIVIPGKEISNETEDEENGFKNTESEEI